MKGNTKRLRLWNDEEGGGGEGGGAVKGVPFSGFRYIKGLGFYEVKYMNG